MFTFRDTLFPTITFPLPVLSAFENKGRGQGQRKVGVLNTRGLELRERN